MTISEAERLIEEWLKEEVESAALPYAEKLFDAGYWILDGRFNVRSLARKLAQSPRVIPFRLETKNHNSPDQSTKIDAAYSRKRP